MTGADIKLYYDQSGKAQLVADLPCPPESQAACTSYTDTGLTNGQQYCYKVTSYSAVCESSFSNILCAIPTQPGQEVLAGVAEPMQTGKWVTEGKGNNQTTAFVLTSDFVQGDGVVIQATIKDEGGAPVPDATVTIAISGPESAGLTTGPSDANGVAEATWQTAPYQVRWGALPSYVRRRRAASRLLNGRSSLRLPGIRLWMVPLALSPAEGSLYKVRQSYLRKCKPYVSGRGVCGQRQRRIPTGGCWRGRPCLFFVGNRRAPKRSRGAEDPYGRWSLLDREGASGSYGFVYYARGQRRRCRLAVGSDVPIDFGEPLEKEAVAYQGTGGRGGQALPVPRRSRCTPLVF